MTIEDIMSAFIELGEAVIADGVQHARTDDPHRFATLPKEFDDGRARRRVQLDYLGSGRVEVSCQLLGTFAGEEKVVALFTTTLQGAAPASGTH